MAAADSITCSIRFICHGGDLEIKSLLLAHSLRDYLPQVELIACIPKVGQGFAPLSDGGRDELSELDVALAEIENPIGGHYPIGNKLAAFSPPTDAEFAIFLDSDMLCRGDFTQALPRDLDFGAVIAEFDSFSGDTDVWHAAYGAVGLELPTLRYKSTISRMTIFPYFNAGMIVTRRRQLLSERWIGIGRQLERLPDFRWKTPHLDQISLPLAISSLGANCSPLESKFNFPAQFRLIDKDVLLAHYHRPEFLISNPDLHAQLRRLTDRSRHLTQLIEADKDWAETLRITSSRIAVTMGPQMVDERRNLVITGIPRTGTSFLCQTLHRVADCVAINEPLFAMRLLQNWLVPYRLALEYQRLRHDILASRPVFNKLHDGEPVSDTVGPHQMQSYQPEVSRSDFILATKNTLSYLSRLKSVRAALPGATVVGCVRNPWDTINSWKRSFPHLRNADVRKPPVLSLDSPFHSQDRRRALHRIDDTASPAERRALLWRFLAELLLDQTENLMLVRYEALIVDPTQLAKDIVRACGLDAVRFLSPPVVRRMPAKNSLSAEDMEAIDAHCLDIAKELGVAVRQCPLSGLTKEPCYSFKRLAARTMADIALYPNPRRRDC